MATAPPPAVSYGPMLRLLVRDDVAVLQPAPAPGATADPAAAADPTAVVDTLCIDLPSGRVSRGQLPPLAPGPAAADVPAVIGLLRLRGGSALAIATRAERVASLDGAPVYRVCGTLVVTPGMRVVGAAGAASGAAGINGSSGPAHPAAAVLSASISVSRVPRAAASSASASASGAASSPAAGAYDAGDRRLLAYLRSALDPNGAGRGLYFAHGAHLTLHTQARAELLARFAAAVGGVAATAGGAPPPPLLSPPRCADRRFFWNRALAAPLLEAGADAFVPTLVMGSLRVLEACPLGPRGGGAPLAADVALFARRAADRAGTRHWRRGADPETGDVANFVETEQVVSVYRRRQSTTLNNSNNNTNNSPTPTTPPILVASFVQVRGSVPLVWTQLPNVAYKPPTVVLDGKATRSAFDAHARALHAAYATAGGGAVTCVNLVNQSGSEGALGARFAAEAARHNGEAEAAAAGVAGAGAPSSCPPLRYVPFDFHHECGATSYGEGLAALWRLLADDFEKDGMWVARAGAAAGGGGGGAAATTTVSRQRGVIRTNCIDCLDRTNVVQGLLGRKALARALAMAIDQEAAEGGDAEEDAGAAAAAAAASPPLAFSAAAASRALAPDGGAGPLLPPQLEPLFKHMWADHGDDVSRQYAGTGALKSGFTRTGKRTFGGLLDDGLKSAARYWLNNFGDGFKQDAVDLATGAYVPRQDARVRFRPRPSPALPVGLALGALAWGGAALGRAFGAAVAAGAAALGGGGGGEGGGGGGGGGTSSALLLSPAALLVEVAAPLALAAALLLLVVRNGRHLVDAPQLCPERANTAAAVAGNGGGVAARLAGGKKKKGGGAETTKMMSNNNHTKAD